MKIRCLTTWLHGQDRYVYGDIRTVDDDLGAYAIAHGWAAPESGAAGPQASGETDLTIHSVTHTQEANHG